MSARAGRRALAPVVVAAVAVAAVVLISTGGGGPTRVPRPRLPSGGSARVQFGSNVNWLFNDLSYTTVEIDGQLSALQATGVTLARSDALWEAAEPAPPSDGVHHYNWSFDDRIARSLAGHGLRWLPIVDYSAPWAESVPGQDHSAPNSASAYAAYAGALAARYGPGGEFWRLHPGLAALPSTAYEIWNEPDNPQFWSPAPDASAYAELYSDARRAILSVQPRAAVLVGGLTNLAGFLPAMLGAAPSLQGEIDGVALHPYGHDPAVVLARVNAARRVLDELGMSAVPLWVTEVGWTTRPPGSREWAPERLRPGYIADTLEALARPPCDIDAVILYTWTTPDQDPTDSQQWYGISPPGAGGSADVSAFERGVQAARAAGGGGGGSCAGS